MEFLINLKTWFNLKMTCHAHGWVNLEPFQWFEESETLRWSALIGSHGHVIRVSQIDPTTLRVFVESLGETEAVEQCIRRVLMLDWNAIEAKKVAELCSTEIAHMIESGAGRLLRGSSEFEDVVKTICTINTSWANTKNMVRNLVKISSAGAFPTPDEILETGTERLQEEARVGYRARTIIAAAQLAKDAGSETWDSLQLERLTGVGPYASAHFSVLRGDYSTIPVDSEVKSYCSQHLKIQEPNVEKVNHFFKQWGNYRFLGYKLGRMVNSSNWIGE